MSQHVPGFEIARAVPLGRLTLTLPPRRGLSRKGRHTLDLVIAAEADGLLTHATAWLTDLERLLGVTTDDRLVAGSLPNARGIDPDDMDRLAQAEATLRSRTAPSNLRKEAKRAILDVKRRQAQRVERADSADVERGIAESFALAANRGELVCVETVAGRRRATKLGGLQLAFERGVLDTTSVRGESLLRAAELYRDLYEIAIGGRGPDRTENLAMGGVSSGFGPKSMLPQVQASQELQRTRDGLTKVQRQTCDLVCGLDFTVAAAAKRLGKNYRTLEKALAEGLKRVGENKDWW